MGITIKQREEKWRVEIREESWEFPTREDLDKALKTLLDLKQKNGRVNN